MSHDLDRGGVAGGMAATISLLAFTADLFRAPEGATRAGGGRG